MGILEIIAIISTLLSVIASGKVSIATWPLSIISALSLIGIYYNTGMVGNILLQTVFIIQSVVGWYMWRDKDEVVISSHDKKSVQSSTIFFIGLGSTLALFHPRGISYWLAMFDGISTGIALLATWYLTKKYIQSWTLFMIYNVIIGGVLLVQGNYCLVILNIILFCISLKAYFIWKKDLKTV